MTDAIVTHRLHRAGDIVINTRIVGEGEPVVLLHGWPQSGLAWRGRGRLRMPVLALGGEACLADAPLLWMQAVADDVRGGVVPRCGHWMAEEQPDELAARLLNFFAYGKAGESG